MPKLSIRISIFERIVKAVGVAVVVLRIGGRLDVVVRTEETALQGVVHAAVHVDEAQGVYVLVTCEAAVHLHGTGSERALTPGVIGGV